MGPWAISGALLLGARLVLYEGTPDFPGPDRLWAIVERHGVTHLGLSPTVIRAFMAAGVEPVRSHDLGSLRVLGSTGEPWNPEPWPPVQRRGSQVVASLVRDGAQMHHGYAASWLDAVRPPQGDTLRRADTRPKEDPMPHWTPKFMVDATVTSGQGWLAGLLEVIADEGASVAGIGAPSEVVTNGHVLIALQPPHATHDPETEIALGDQPTPPPDPEVERSFVARVVDTLVGRGFTAGILPAETIAVPEPPGSLARALRKLDREGCTINGLVVIGMHDGEGDVRVCVSHSCLPREQSST